MNKQKTNSWIFFTAILIIAILELAVFKQTNNAEIFKLLAAIDIITFIALSFWKADVCLNIAMMALPFAKVAPIFDTGILTLTIFTGPIILLTIVCCIKIIIGKAKYNVLPIDLILFFFAALACSFFFLSPDITKSGRIFYETTVTPTLTYFIICTILTDEEKFNSFKNCLVLAVTLSALVIMYRAFSTGNRDHDFRVLSNAILIIISMFILISKGRKSLLALTVVNFLGLLAAMTRVIIASFLLTPIIGYFIKKGWIKVVFIVVVLSTLIFTIGVAQISERKEYTVIKSEFLRSQGINTTAARLDNSAARMTSEGSYKMALIGRGVAWREELQSVLLSPIIGVGIGNTRLKGVASSHNLHVQLLAYTGLLGYFLFHVFIFMSLIKNSTLNSELDYNLKYFNIAIIIIYLNGITNGLFHGTFNYYLFMVIALIQVVNKLKQRSASIA